MAPELLRALSVAGIAVGVLFALLTVVGVVLLVRRNRRAGTAGTPGRSVELQADSALLKLDDAVAGSAAELAFAAAQFGSERTQPFADALAHARRDLAEAFDLKRRLDDAQPEAERERAEWNRRILTLTERSLSALEAHEREFSAMRAAEASAPDRIRRVRAMLEELDALAADRASVLELAALQHDAAAMVAARDAVTVAGEELSRAERSLRAAEAGLTGPVTTVGDAITDAERSVERARSLLDVAADAERSLQKARDELGRMTAFARGQLDESRARRSAAPDADSADGITRAVADLEGLLARQSAPGVVRDPVQALGELQTSLGRLDTALATARNQQQRLSSAREALEGALFSARSQIAAARSAVGGRAASAGARARLAEAERELELALRSADPVEALDAARRASTHARDADALARYRGTP